MQNKNTFNLAKALAEIDNDLARKNAEDSIGYYKIHRKHGRVARTVSVLFGGMLLGLATGCFIQTLLIIL